MSEKIDAKVVVSYSDARRENMKKIGEKICLATTDLIKQRILDQGIEILKIRHADKPNGSIDLTYLISGAGGKIKLLENNFEELKSKTFGISHIAIYLANPV